MTRRVRQESRRVEDVWTAEDDDALGVDMAWPELWWILAGALVCVLAAVGAVFLILHWTVWA